MANTQSSLHKLTMLTRLPSLLLLLFGFVPLIDSKCLDYHYSYTRGNTKACYLFIRPSHITALRNELNVWNDRDSIPNNVKSVIKNRAAAEEACKVIQSLPPNDKYFKGVELEESKQFQPLGHKSMKSKLADPRAPVDVQWLLQTAYGTFNKREGGSAFIQLLKSSAGKLRGKVEPKEEKEVMKDYNPGTTGLLIFDPGFPHHQGLIWVDKDNPYGATLPIDKKVHYLICEYKEAKDCQFVPMAPQKCTPHEETLICTWYDFVVKEESDEYGAPCDENYKNRTVRCPWHRRDECKSDCQWGEWISVEKCPNPKIECGPDVNASWGRLVVRDAIDGEECDEVKDGVKFTNCPCSGHPDICKWPYIACVFIVFALSYKFN